MQIQIELDRSDVQALRARTGLRDASRALRAWIGAAREPEPLTPAQCRRTFSKHAGPIKISPKMRAVGLDESFFT